MSVPETKIFIFDNKLPEIKNPENICKGCKKEFPADHKWLQVFTSFNFAQRPKLHKFCHGRCYVDTKLTLYREAEAETEAYYESIKEIDHCGLCEVEGLKANFTNPPDPVDLGGRSPALLRFCSPEHRAEYFTHR